jgi:phosphatidylglycerol:prolipoprotein diacylglycerol transferase
MQHHINPVIADLGLLQIRWYGFLYLLSFLIAFFLLRRNFHYRGIKLKKDDYENFIFNLCLGVIIGGRLGYAVFYNLPFYLEHPLKLLAVWEGGMSFHGGAIAVIYIGWRFCRKHKYNFFQLADVTAPVACIGLGLGRLGNFINGELFGKVTTLPWGIIFPDGGKLPRHPSQLYEMFLEGIVLFLITQTVLRKSRREGIVLWVWLLGYGLFRGLVEFVRIPDEQIGYIWNTITMGQILSIFMIISGLAGIIFHHPTIHEKRI